MSQFSISFTLYLVHNQRISVNKFNLVVSLNIEKVVGLAKLRRIFTKVLIMRVQLCKSNIQHKFLEIN